MSPAYRDIPIPPRGGARSTPVPAGFGLRFAFDGEELHMSASVAGVEEVPVYEGRGRFRYADSDERFTVSALSLLDPFLWQHQSIPPRSFKIVLRVILPKLSREGLSIHCALRLSEHPPVKIEVQPVTPEGSAQVRALWAVPRDALQALPGLDEYVVGDHCLYRANLTQLRDVPPLDENWQTLSGEALRSLGRLCDRAGVLFDGPGVTTLRSLGRGLPLRRQEPEKTPTGESDPLKEFLASVRDQGRFIPSSEKRVELAAPALISAELFSATQPNSSKYAFFFSEARNLRELHGQPAPSVPLTCYWPTYSAMNRAQKAWYFYWRGEFLAGKPLKTDLAYLFVAVYELINNCVAEPPEALSRLLRLWEAYREPYPYLDRVMPGWCVDYILLNGLEPDFDPIHTRIPFHLDGQSHLAELFCNTRLGQGIHTLPLEALATLSGYDMPKSRFFAGNETLCRESVPKALCAAASHYEKTHQLPLLTAFKPPPRSIQWESFRGAVCAQASSRRIKLTYLPYAQNPAFTEWISNVLRCTENLLRKNRRFPGRLRCTDPSMEAVIARALQLEEAPPKAPPEQPVVSTEPIRIDLARAKALENASWDNTRRLLDALEASADPESPTDFPPQEAADPACAVPAPVIPEPSPADPEQTMDAAAAVPEAAEDPCDGFLGMLSPLQLQVLQALLDENDALAFDLCAAQMTFPDAVIEEINVAAVDVLGDLLIDSASSRVFEDYAPTLLERMN